MMLQSPLDEISTFQLTGMHWSLIDAAEIARLEGLHKEEFVRLAAQYWDEEIKMMKSGKGNQEELLLALLCRRTKSAIVPHHPSVRRRQTSRSAATAASFRESSKATLRRRND